MQHLAFKVGSYDELVAAKEHLTANGIDVLGPTHHGIFKSIYFFDPNGHRVELACDIGTDEQYAELKRVAPLMICALAMPLTFSIANGIAFGFIAWVAIKALSGRFKDLNPALVVLALIFVIKFAYGTSA